jgi:hypothetical protein
VIGPLVATACTDPVVLARLGGSIGEAARAAAEELAGSQMLRARVLAAVRVPVPAGIRGVHPSWIEAGLVGLPVRARQALASGPSDSIDVWLVRWACAAIPPLPAADPAAGAAASPASIDDAVRLPGDGLARWLAEVGADQLAHAVRKAGVRAIAEVATRVIGDRLRAAAARIDRAPRAGALGPARAAIARCRGELRAPVRSAVAGDASTVRAQPLAITVAAGVDEHLLVRIGCRAIAPHVDALARQQLAVRLPRPLGLIVRDELASHARTPVAECPTWLALGAAW